MAIEGIGPVDPVPNYQPVDRTAAAGQVGSVDSVEISSAAQAASEALRIATEIALNSPDIRADLVGEAARNLQDPAYPGAEVLDTVSDRILDSFGI